MPESSQTNNYREVLLKYAANILSRRPYFASILRQKLFLRAEKEGLSDPSATIEKIISDLSESKYLDDDYLAGAFVRRQLGKGYGPFIISQKLKQFGLSKEVILKATSNEATEEVQISAIKRLFRKNQSKDKRKLYYKILNRGFSSLIVRKVFDCEDNPD